jgi:hypothetical protein
MQQNVQLERAIVNKSNDPAEAYEAARKLQKIPRNANPYPSAQSLQDHRTSKRLYPSVWPFSYPIP